MLYQSILVVTVLSFTLPGFRVELALPAVLFFVVYGLAFLNEARKSWRSRSKQCQPIREKPQPGVALKNPMFKKNVAGLMEGLNAKAFLERRRMPIEYKDSPIEKERDRLFIRCLRALYHLAVIMGFNYAFILWIRLVGDMKFIFSAVLVIAITLVYPALLYGVLRWLARGILTRGIVIHCLLSLCVFLLLFEDRAAVLYLLFPTLCFGGASLVSAIRGERRRKVRVTRGADPIPEDEVMVEERMAKRQIDRKHKSQWENVRWYTNFRYRGKSVP